MKFIKTFLYLSLPLALANGLQIKTYTALAKIWNLILFLVLLNTYGNEIEHKNGVSGIRQLINCGKGEDNYFKVVDQLTGINKANFDAAIRKLIAP